MNFKLTKDQIHRGRRGSFTECPIALMAKETLSDLAVNFSVNSTELRVLDGNGVRIFKLPENAKQFISTFDGLHGEEERAEFEKTQENMEIEINSDFDEFLKTAPRKQVPPATLDTVDGGTP